ncbi:rhomboid family intramembrane serine protease [Rurimicrobium arvi]|uniref:Rhomboid family intramembrane serine protease n=1 Tax=Rurimicrobium arvi TaxID=2049916 RepID=A0ABP8MR59_9BACT
MDIFTIGLLLLTVGVSFWAFTDAHILNKLILYPYVMKRPAEYYRLLTSGFIHADWTHLIFNMITLYFVGGYVEYFFVQTGQHAMFLLLYLAGVVVASLPSFFKHRNNHYYRSLGASGGTSAVLFSMVYISPWTKITVFVFPVWAILFAVLYVAYSIYASKRGQDHINHEAHLWGGVFGFVFTFIFDPTHGQLFLQQIMNPVL